MADSVVSFLLENVSQLLTDELNLLGGAEEQVRSLESWLKLTKEFLKKTSKNREHDIVRELVDQIRDAAQEAEDTIDSYVVHRLKQQRRSKLGKLFHHVDHGAELHRVASNVVNIKNRIQEIYDNRDTYGIDLNGSINPEYVALLHRRRKDVEEDDVVGFIREAEMLKTKLIGQEWTAAFDVISIVGMGGLGKTTLARKIYNDVYIKDHFNCRGWVYVSNDFRIRDLLLRILRCVTPITEEISSMEDADLKEKLCKFLTGRRYLIVLDDVWQTDLWDEIKKCFPDNNNGSKILVTSRIKEVALYTSSTPPLLLILRNEAESWELFSKKVFRHESCPGGELEELGKRMANDCNGLPLSLVVLAGLLVTKEKSPRAWKKIVGNVSWYLTQDSTRCLDILALSFDNLPHHLKPCFLYLGLYPEDYEIPARQLIQLWIAEGFIECCERTMEDLAEDYLEELIDRSLVQVAKRRTDGGVKTCRIHDLLRDLCIKEATRERFLEIYPRISDNAIFTPSTKPRRLSIQCGTPNYISSEVLAFSCTRSFLSFDQDSPRLTLGNGKYLCKGLKLIKVLDLGVVVIEGVPDKIGRLVYIRYLKLNAPSLRNIPRVICNLPNLQTLNLRGSRLNSLPNDIWKLRQLRHLYLSGPVSLPPSSKCLALENLLTLSTVAMDEEFKMVLKNGSLPKLETLGLMGYNESISIKELHLLKHLKFLKVIKEVEYDFYDPSGGKFIPYIFPSTLTKVTLSETKLPSLKGLRTIPCLQILKLIGEALKGGGYLKCEKGSFAKLQTFHMVRVNVSNWHMEEGALLNLQHLVINETVLLRSFPKQLWEVKALRRIQLMFPHSMLHESIPTDASNDILIDIYPPPC